MEGGVVHAQEESVELCCVRGGISSMLGCFSLGALEATLPEAARHYKADREAFLTVDLDGTPKTWSAEWS